MPQIDLFLNQELARKQTPLFNDLKLNFQKLIEDSTLEKKETFTNLVAISRTLDWAQLEAFSISVLKELNLSETEIEECLDIAALMSMNNTYYKFKGALAAVDAGTDPAYARIGLRNTSLKQTSIGPHLTETMAFTVSVINGCPNCMTAHEKALTNLGVSRDKIHDLARLASVTKGLSLIK